MMRHQSNEYLADRSSLKQPHTLAFYVNFNSSFRFLGAEKKIFANKEFVTTYFNLLFLQAFVNDLDKLYREGKIALNEINLVLSVLSKMMGITETSLDSFPKLVSDIVRFICTTRQGSFLERSVQTNLSTKDFLSSFVGQLRNRSALFTKSTVAFLLDDYATDWLPEEVSQMINQIIFERTTNCCFKIAAIPGRQNFSLGYSHSLELGRNYVLINMALFDVFPYVKSREEFLRTILDKRLALSGLSMDSRFIFDSRPKSNEPVDYSGIANLARLSNSDIRTVIALCNHMINSEGTVGIPISRETQNKVIRNYSRTLIKELKSGLEWGNYVADFLQQFMDFSQNLFLVSKQHERHPIPKERRFEGFKIDNEADIKLEAKKRLFWLVRSGVVQESRRSSRTEDFLIRKIFFPAFGVPISGQSYFVMLNAESCEIMLINPKKFWGQFSKRILPGLKDDKDSLDE